MSRLASFRGPSTPTSQPVASSPQPSFPPLSTPRTPKKSKQNRQGFTTPSSPAPSSPNRDRRDSGLIQSPRRRKSTLQQGETDAKGKMKTAVDGPSDTLIQARRILLDIRGCAKRWNELVNEGSGCAKEIVDSRTRIENALALIPLGQLPREPIVTPHMVVINEKIPLMENTVDKMHDEFLKTAHLIDDLEGLLFEAANTYGVQWAEKRPLWRTWSLDQFATLLPSLLPQYARAYHIYAHQLLPTLRTSASSFEISRAALGQWIALSKVDGNGEGNGWFGDPLNRGWTWEEICAVEVEGWK